MNKKLKAMIVLKFECQDNFAEAVNENPSFVSRVVRARREISDKRKLRWAKALGCRPEEIFPDIKSLEINAGDNDRIKPS
jgi:hypothetical protein